MQGFVYEADQQKVREAEQALDQARHKETIAQLDDSIEALEHLKKVDNLFDFFGAKLEGTMTGIDVYKAISDLNLGEYIAHAVDTSLDSIVGTIKATLSDRQKYTDSTLAQGGYTSNYQVEIGDIILQNVANPEQLAEAIKLQLGSAITQRLYTNR